MTKYVDANIVKKVLDSSKGRFMSILVDKVDGTERSFNFQKCSENARSFKYKKDLVSIVEKGEGYKSFYMSRVKQIKFNGQVLKAS